MVLDSADTIDNDRDKTYIDLRYFMPVKHTARTGVEPFDYVASSRLANPISTDFSGHLGNFLKLGTQCNLPESTWASYIASVILLDAYPQGMHRKSTVNCFLSVVLT